MIIRSLVRYTYGHPPLIGVPAHAPPAPFLRPDVPVHVMQRGNNRQAVFFDDDDYRVYLNWLGEAAAAHGCAIHA